MTSHMSLRQRGSSRGVSYYKDGHHYMLLFDRVDMFMAGVACFRWAMHPELTFNIDDGTDIADMMAQTWVDRDE